MIFSGYALLKQKARSEMMRGRRKSPGTGSGVGEGVIKKFRSAI
jgi:hypothetical protein